MAVIKNAIDELLQAASPRIEPISLASNISVGTANLNDGSVTPSKTALPAIDPLTGNLAVNSVTANNIDVLDLSAISADLGTVTAGDITGSANLSVSGYVKAAGSLLTQVTYAGNYGAATGQFITSGGAASASEWDVGVWGQVNGTLPAAGKIGIIGIADQSNGYGVVGESAAGKGVYGESSAGAALAVNGVMEITDSTMVLNLNAQYVGGVDLGGLVRNNEVDLLYSTDGGGSWNTIRFKPA
jgi:hypothetical protein